MSSNDSKTPSGSMSRKERRAAERAARKSGGSSSSSTKSKSSGRSSGPSMAIISIGAIVIGVVLVAALVLASGGLGGNDAAAIEEPDTPAPAAELRDGFTLVAADATPPVTIEVFEDVQCPHCQTFTERIEPLIIAEHVSSGLASLTYNDYIIFGDKSTQAAVAMRAADKLGDAFWDYHHTIYHNAEDGDFDRAWFGDIAEAVGLEREAFLALLDDDELAADVSASNALAASYGISSTPSVVVNGQLIGSPSWEELDAAVKAAAEAAGSAD